MAQAGFTPIQLYFSTTAAATPSAGNLANGELAVNITDGKLFYKDNGGVVRVLATTAGSAGDVVGPGSSTDNALVRFDSTTGKLVQNSVGILSDAGALSGLASVAATTFTGALTGNASTATTLQTSRTIWGQSFDGSANVTGALTGVTDLTASGSLTLNGGTANGVAYLNGSKVLTTGSALTFDGTNLATSGSIISSTAPAGGSLKRDVTSSYLSVTGGTAPNSNGATILLSGSTYVAANTAFVDATESVFRSLNGASEYMRLTSTGLGIGTSSPVAKLDVVGGIRSSASITINAPSGNDFISTSSSGNVRLGWGTYGLTGGPILGTDGAYPLIFAPNQTERMRLDSSGNLGLGTTSPANFSGYQTFTANGSTGGIFNIQVAGTNAFRIASDANQSYLFEPRNLPMSFATNGSERARISAAGNMGIGTTDTSNGRLNVAGPGTATANSVFFSNVDGTYNPYLQIQHNGLSGIRFLVSSSFGGTAGNLTIAPANVDTAVFTTSGNFGVGTTSPNYLIDSQTTSTAITTNLKVNAGAAAGNYGEIAFQTWNGAGSGLNTFGGSGNSRPSVVLRGLSEDGNARGAFVVATFGGGSTNATLTEKMRLDSFGNLGVGTSSPAARLDVRGSATNFDGIRVLNTESSSGVQTTSSVRIGITNSVGVRYTKIQAIESNTDSNSVSMAFFVNSANAVDSEFEAARIDSAGQFTTAFSGGSGSVGIRAGTSTAAASNFFFFMGTAAGVDRFQVRGDGNVYNTNGVYGTLSDLKRKENVTDATPKLEKLQQVRVVNYNLIGEEQKQLGVIAQELEQIFPSMVEETSDRDKDGNDLGTTTKAVKYSVFVPMLIKAMQEQQAIIESLKARLDAANL